MDLGKLPEDCCVSPVRRRRSRSLLPILAVVVLAAATGGRWLYREQNLEARPDITGETSALADGQTAARATTAAHSDEEMAGALAQRIESADAEATAGRHEVAARLLTEALELQRSLNGRFPGSRFASLGRLASLELERQTQQAAGPLDELAAMERQLDARLRRREVYQARRLAAEAAQKLTHIAEQYPKSSGLDGALRRKLAVLTMSERDLAAVQDTIYDHLLPLPTDSARLMLRTEVTQALYARVMTVNPSRREGATLPVDSVTHAEAGEFCRRLEWILGRSVRLPTEEQYRAVLEVAQGAGFVDPNGRGSEWLCENGSEALDDTAPLAEFGFPSTRRVSVGRAARNARSATQGFRVLVEMGDEE